ncbi:MAG: hypothetical protein ACI3YI_04790, partial [Bacteroidaceae bacterium]
SLKFEVVISIMRYYLLMISRLLAKIMPRDYSDMHKVSPYKLVVISESALYCKITTKISIHETFILKKEYMA